MRPPCEFIVRYFLPTFRSLIAKELIEKHKFSQVEAAEKLGTTQAAISHYLYSKRGDKRLKHFHSIPSVQLKASEVALEIASGELSDTDAMIKFCELCFTLRTEGVICGSHRDSFPSLPEICDICQEIMSNISV